MCAFAKVLSGFGPFFNASATLKALVSKFGSGSHCKGGGMQRRCRGLVSPLFCLIWHQIHPQTLILRAVAGRRQLAKSAAAAVPCQAAT